MSRTHSPVRLRLLAAPAAALVTLFCACADPGTGLVGPAISLPTAAFGKAPATTCSSRPVKPLVVTPSALLITAGQTASFTACTQYEGRYAVTSSNTAVANVLSSVVPTQAGLDEPYIATVSVSVPSGAQGEASITITDKKGNQRTVAVTVLPPPATFGYSGEITTYQIPISGRYTITAAGAAGGDGWSIAPGGVGATAQGDFNLTAGTVLTIVVGGRGSSAGSNPASLAGGGGGGSFVVLAPTDPSALPTPVIVGGGGGGAGQTPGPSGKTDVAGAGGSGLGCCDGFGGSGGSDGLGGSGGSNTFRGIGGGGGGGGLLGTGADGLGASGTNARGGGAYTSTPRFAGGMPCSNGGGTGGFGGGGGGCGGSGGGAGGYSGGGGGGGGARPGGGGGSYVNTSPPVGAGFTFVAGTNSMAVAASAGDGAVTITFKSQ